MLEVLINEGEDEVTTVSRWAAETAASLRDDGNSTFKITKAVMERIPQVRDALKNNVGPEHYGRLWLWKCSCGNWHGTTGLPKGCPDAFTRVMWVNEHGSGDARSRGYIVRDAEQARKVIADCQRDRNGTMPIAYWSPYPRIWYSAGRGGSVTTENPIDAEYEDLWESIDVRNVRDVREAD